MPRNKREWRIHLDYLEKDTAHAVIVRLKDRGFDAKLKRMGSPSDLYEVYIRDRV